MMPQLSLLLLQCSPVAHLQRSAITQAQEATPEGTKLPFYAALKQVPV